MSNATVMRDELGEDLIIRETMRQMKDKIMNGDEKTFVPIIIVMKGDAYTGKSTCADAIANSLKCSVLTFDDILDSLSPSPPTSPEEGDRLRDVAFNVLLRVAKLQLLILRPVVIDCPLSDPLHLQRVLKILDFCNCCFAIVECKPAVKYAWKMRFEKRDRRETDKYWFKPKEWDYVEETPSVEWNECLPDTVSRLIVDTTGYVDLSNLGRAIIDIVCCVKSHLLHYEEWEPLRPLHPSCTFSNFCTTNKAQPRDECGSDGRHMLEEGVHTRADTSTMHNPDEVVASSLVCGSCQGPISYSDPAYACRRCNKLALHKCCAELPDHQKTVTPLPVVSVVPDVGPSEDSITEEDRRRLAPICDRIFIEDFWEAHLSLRILPTILLHEGAPSHSVCFWFTSLANPRSYQCAACKLCGALYGYTCLETIFRFNLHVECALLPSHVPHLHGGYQHDMRLVFGTRDVQEDYLCDVCGDVRDPSAWYYYCDHCVFVSHLHCIYASGNE